MPDSNGNVHKSSTVTPLPSHRSSNLNTGHIHRALHDTYGFMSHNSGMGKDVRFIFKTHIVTLLSVISFVISQGNEILVDYDKGSQDDDSVYRCANRTAVITGVINMFCAYLIYLNGETLVGLFTQDQEVSGKPFSTYMQEQV